MGKEILQQTLVTDGDLKWASILTFLFFVPIPGWLYFVGWGALTLPSWALALYFVVLREKLLKAQTAFELMMPEIDKGKWGMLNFRGLSGVGLHYVSDDHPGEALEQ